MPDSSELNYLKLKQLIIEDKVLLLVHKKYTGLNQSTVYTRCGISQKYFEQAYKNGDIVLQFGQLGIRIGYPIPWEKALNDFLEDKM